ncbi:MAG TPA: hydroxymethylbilane synthase [Pirellulaceae bacterium]|nr:hydroxymethylbilane synthase [Pirellulaceae bacterium]
MSVPRLRLGTRASPLARWQAQWVAARLGERGVEVEMVHISTQGDVKAGPLGQIGGQGLFTKEIQRALLAREIDLAVHSLKDLPTEPVAGLCLAAVPPRETTADVLVSARFGSLDHLPPGARVGTGSLRRKAQLLFVRPDLTILDIRGNVDTRLKKLDDGEYDAIVLAAAGLTRLGFADRMTFILPRNIMLPAIGQGALGLETREDDSVARTLVEPLDDPQAHAAVLAERTMLHALRGGCLAPVGALGRVEEAVLKLEAVVLSGDGKRRISADGAGQPEDAVRVGEQVAEELLVQGAGELIASSRGGAEPNEQ